jgi:hypothetical protein
LRNFGKILKIYLGNMKGKNNMENEEILWKKLIDSYYSYIIAVQDFLSSNIDRVTFLKTVLRSSDRSVALHVLQFLKIEELMSLFDDLIFLASFSHGGIEVVRAYIHKLPQDWVITNIKNKVEPLLINGDYDQYRRILELYISLDKNLTKELAQRAVSSSDPDIKEAGEDFIEMLKKEGSY